MLMPAKAKSRQKTNSKRKKWKKSKYIKLNYNKNDLKQDIFVGIH